MGSARPLVLVSSSAALLAFCILQCYHVFTTLKDNFIRPH